MVENSPVTIFQVVKAGYQRRKYWRLYFHPSGRPFPLEQTEKVKIYCEGSPNMAFKNKKTPTQLPKALEPKWFHAVSWRLFLPK